MRIKIQKKGKEKNDSKLKRTSNLKTKLMSKSNFKHFIFSIIVLLISFLIKILNIEKGNFVMWDEAHFGKFSQNYLSRKFYTDVHPPFAKMMVALSGYLYGQSESFLFSSSERFPDTFNYVGMRRFHALIGSFISFSMYYILKLLGFSHRRCFIGSMLTVFDNGITNICRLILLDSYLLAFTSFTTLFFIYYKKSGGSKSSLFLLGCSIGFSLSIKWIGALTMLYVGFYIIFELYNHVITQSFSTCIIFFVNRFIYLIILPFSIYLFWIFAHLTTLSKNSSEASNFSVKFNFNFEDNQFSKYRKYISYGKQITIKTKGGYLHSHKHTYPGLKISQDNKNLYQSTTYTHRDENNIFYFQRAGPSKSNEKFMIEGDEVVLLHEKTNGYLESDNKRSYIGSGKRTFFQDKYPTEKSVFIVEKDKNKKIDTKYITSLFEEFYLKNKETGKYLSISGENYPNTWGFGQGEIVLNEKSKLSKIMIEENLYAEKTNNPFHKIERGRFFSNAWELNKNMWNINNILTQDPNEERAEIISDPYEWFILKRGLRMTQWDNDKRPKFYLLMNPLILYPCSFSIIYSLFKYFIIFINFLKKWKRIKTNCINLKSSSSSSSSFNENKNKKEMEENISKAKKATKKIKKEFYKNSFLIYFSVGAWFIHYIPFFFINRVLYIHHYFPSYFFNIIALNILLKKINFKFVLIYAISVVAVFYLYSPLCYGFYKPKEVAYLNLIPTWKLIDN